MAERGLGVPPKFDESDYDLWKEKIDMWKDVTNLTKSKLAMVVVINSLSDGSKIQKCVIDELGKEKLNHEEGLKRLFEFMDRFYLKNNLLTAFEHLSEFNKCKFENYSSMDEYILDFNRLYKKASKGDGMKMQDKIKGLYLLDNANLNHRDKQLVLTGVDLNKEELHSQVEASLLKFFGKQATSSMKQSMSSMSLKDKDEDALTIYSWKKICELKL